MALGKKIKKSQEKLRKNKQNIQQQDENNPSELGNLKVKRFFLPLFPLNETINFFRNPLWNIQEE